MAEIRYKKCSCEMIEKAPENFTIVLLECVAMPNGELISNGKSLGHIAKFPKSVFKPIAEEVK